MSSIVNKVKDAVSGHHSSSAPEGTHGTHNSRVANAADPRIDSDRDHRAAPGSTVGGTHEYTSGNNYTHGTTGTTGGYGSSTGTTGAYGTTGSTGREGPHSSNLANKLDPRIDSDRSGTRVGNTAGDHYGSGPEGVHGPHQSRLANAADPRVDSDRDASRTVGNTYGSSGTYGTTGAHSTTGTTGTHGTTGSTGREGPHNSNIANKLDPRIDSDRSGTHVGNTAGDHYGSGPEGVHGPHQSRLANAADPRVDSDRDASRTVGNTYGSSGTYGTTGAHGTHGTTHGTSQIGGNYAPGPAPHTAGPHKSDALNKADPRVDSDLDGSKTIGGNKTYGAGSGYGSSTAHKDPTDAAQVPPSVMQKAVGPPSIEHDDVHHGRERRHSLKTSQEREHGL